MIFDIFLNTNFYSLFSVDTNIGSCYTLAITRIEVRAIIIHHELKFVKWFQRDSVVF